MSEYRIKVGDKYRKNPKSLIEGGSTVFVKRVNPKTGNINIVEYKNIKNVTAYINHIKKNEPNFIDYWLEGEEPKKDPKSNIDEDDLPF
jgi:hypothetical protein